MNRVIQYPMATRSKYLSFAWAVLSLIYPFILSGQIPARPNPPVLVNDLASIFTAQEKTELERMLVAFSDSTSNQIVVVTISDLGNMEKSSFAYEIGEKWGVGQSKFDNGVVILVKPKTGSTRGETFIAVGYGLEGIIPDAICKRIIETEMIPHFKSNDYYRGLLSAIKVIMALASREYSSDEYANRANKDGNIASIIVIIFIVLFVILSAIGKNRGGGNSNIGGKRRNISASELFLLGSLLNGSGRGGGWSGGGSSGGGFGGFGGGGFGGGGAGGSW